MSVLDKIKKNAKASGARIQTSEETKLETMLNQLFFLDKNIKEETKFVKQVMTRGAESQERVGLHASSMLVGDKEFCQRAQVLSLIYKQLQREQVPVGLMRIFEEGNAIHEKWQRLFIRGDYGNAVDMDFTKMNEEYKMSYTPDIISYIPELWDGKMIGEIKSVNTYQFQKMSHHPSAWKQCQWYMHLEIMREKKDGTWNGIDFTKGFVLNEDKNNQDFKVEIHDYDIHKVAPFVQRAEEVIVHHDRVFEEKKMVKRPSDANSPMCKRCSKCVMREACWDVGKGKIRLEV